MLLLHAYLGVAPLSGRVVRAEKQLASYYDDNYSSRITVGRRASSTRSRGALGAAEASA